MLDYTAIADALAADIRSGALKPGERLPPQREFAYQRSIAPSTAARVYAELIRRGLATGEVGRGTFVSSPLSRRPPALTEPSGSDVDLSLNFPIVEGQSAALQMALRVLLREKTLEQISGPIGTRATPSARAVAAAFLTRGQWRPQADAILFTGNGRQAIAAALSALSPPGGRLGVEPLTYPVLKGLAARLGITLVPIACDAEGLSPDALQHALRTTSLNGLYVQPSLHNPLGATMGVKRRQALAVILQDAELHAIEDAVYGFLVDEEPLAFYAPDRIILVDSLSKRIAPGVTLGFLVAPAGLQERLISSVRSGAWAAAGLSLASGLQLMSDGTADRIMALKRNDARSRHALARRMLTQFAVEGDPRAYHILARLPDRWRAEAFALTAATKGVSVIPASAFAVSTGHAPNAVRLALSSPALPQLAASLETLNQLARATSQDIE
ncbi:PLP-dependent aminotransferase family protein [Brevundimonas olei]